MDKQGVYMDFNHQICQVALEKIVANTHQPRKYFEKESLEELAQSIKSYGVIQPITIRHHSDGGYELIAGERRYKAANMAGLKEIPCIILEADQKQSAAMALIENLQREDLNFIEEAEAYQKLLILLGMSQKEPAHQIGKKQSTIANKIRLLQLSKVVQKELMDGQLTERHGRALLKLHDEKDQLKVVRRAIRYQMNVKETERFVEAVLKKKDSNDEKRNLKNYINYRIYVNTLKHAYKEIMKTGVKAEFHQEEHDDYVEVTVKIPKNK